MVDLLPYAVHMKYDVKWVQGKTSIIVLSLQAACKVPLSNTDAFSASITAQKTLAWNQLFNIVSVLRV